jgi:hypothetical protein
MIIRTYQELYKLKTFIDRYNYLKLNGVVGESTFGFDRIFNQRFYTSPEWKTARNAVIIRDYGCDLGIEDRAIIREPIIIHHMNPITIKDIESGSELLFNPEFLISTSHRTHNAIHYGDEKLLIQDLVERQRNDTCPWRK